MAEMINLINKNNTSLFIYMYFPLFVYRPLNTKRNTHKDVFVKIVLRTSKEVCAEHSALSVH